MSFQETDLAEHPDQKKIFNKRIFKFACIFFKGKLRINNAKTKTKQRNKPKKTNKEKTKKTPTKKRK